jgi:hypothetical protein
MSLTPQEKKALELLNDAVDGLLSVEDQQFFDTILTQNQTIKRLYNDLKTVKNVMLFHANTHSVLPTSKKATLLKRALEVAKSEVVTKTSTKQISWQNKWSTRILAIAAVLTLSWIGSIYVQGSLTKESSFEYFVSASFVDHKGGYIKPTWEITQNEQAEAAIANVFSYEVHVPVIKGATFMGIVDVEDESGNHLPMLEYRQEDINEYIYLFAFDMSKPNKPAQKRLREAIFNCRTQTDYHVSDLGGKHVVSWKWGETWYSAVSNHDGNDLAALIEPLNP